MLRYFLQELEERNPRPTSKRIKPISEERQNVARGVTAQPMNPESALECSDDVLLLWKGKLNWHATFKLGRAQHHNKV